MKVHPRIVYAELQKHHGAENAITSPDLASVIGHRITERLIRASIEKYANTPEWPGLLCGIPGSGYFFAQTIEEFATYRDYLKGLSNTAKLKVKRADEAAKREGLVLEGVA